MVEFRDGSVLAQLGTPDMRTPIANCLGYPERVESGSSLLDFLSLKALTFEAPDLTRFPCLSLAYAALRRGPAATISVNAANEIAVEAFLDRRLPFNRIATVIETALAAAASEPPPDIDAVIDVDRQARALALAEIARHAR
jgi:1-deoxy-D-xylulose-5-phosphate reductoisomerase